MKKELPKLPHGYGSYKWHDDNTICYRKRVTYDGRSKDLYVYGKTIKEVNSKMIEKEEEFKKIQKKETIQLKTQTLEQGMIKWLERYKKSEVTAKSYDRLECTYKAHILYSELGGTQEKLITSDDIQDFMNNVRSKYRKQLSQSSKKKIYELLCMYFRYLYSEQPNLDPMRKVVKPKKDNTIIQDEELIIWDDKEMELITVSSYQKYINGVSGYKYGLIITFLMWSFLRMGELLALQWKDIDMKTGKVNITKQYSTIVNRDDDKGNTKRIIVKPKYSSVRKFTLPSPALDAIKEYKKRAKHINPDDYICANDDGEAFTETRLRQTYTGMITDLQLEKHVTIHGLRHSGISYLLRHGVPIEVVSKMAGHSNVSVTLDTYYSVIESQKDDAMEEFNKKIKIKKPTD